MDAIKIGNERVLLNNITNINARKSEFLRVMSDGCLAEDFYAKEGERQTGLIVTVYFVTGREDSDYVKFCGEEAENFLKCFDAVVSVVQAPK